MSGENKAAVADSLMSLALVSFAGSFVGALPLATKKELALGVLSMFAPRTDAELQLERTLRIEQRAAAFVACHESYLKARFCSCSADGVLVGDEESEAMALADEVLA